MLNQTLPTHLPSHLQLPHFPPLPKKTKTMASTTTTTSPEAAIDTHSRTALATTKQNLRYLYDPSTPSGAPPRRRTRALLRVFRSAILFLFWRLVRYAKYVAIGSLVATVGAGALGTLVSGVGFVVAPTGIAGTILAASIWGVGRWAARRVGRRLEARVGRGGGGGGEGVQRVKRERERERDPEVLPW